MSRGLTVLKTGNFRCLSDGKNTFLSIDFSCELILKSISKICRHPSYTEFCTIFSDQLYTNY